MADESLRVVEFYSGIGGMHFAMKGTSEKLIQNLNMHVLKISLRYSSDQRAIPFYIHTPALLMSFSEGARKVVSEGLMRPLPLIFAAFSEGFEEIFVFFCGGKEKSVNF